MKFIKSILVLVFVSIILFFLTSSTPNKTLSTLGTQVTPGTQVTQNTYSLEVPSSLYKDQIITHKGYILGYCEEHEQARWVAYILTPAKARGEEKRSNHFVPDPLVITGSANSGDYKNSGFDRGHLAPAADMAWDEQAMEESFFYSNMSPQSPSFNRGIWKVLEEKSRYWALQSDTLYIVTGPILKTGLKTIGINQVSVPENYYKVLLVQGKHPKAIAFILENAPSSEPLQSFTVPIDSVETLTQLDFFYVLPDSIEKQLESKVNLKDWWP